MTAFPLFAGTFGTIASALNICALVEPWRCEVVGGVANYIGDPAWCVPMVKLILQIIILLNALGWSASTPARFSLES